MRAMFRASFWHHCVYWWLPPPHLDTPGWDESERMIHEIFYQASYCLQRNNPLRKRLVSRVQKADARVRIANWSYCCEYRDAISQTWRLKFTYSLMCRKLLQLWPVRGRESNFWIRHQLLGPRFRVHNQPRERTIHLPCAWYGTWLKFGSLHLQFQWMFHQKLSQKSSQPNILHPVNWYMKTYYDSGSNIL